MDIEIKEGHDKVCSIHKTSYSEYCLGCSVDRSYLLDPERAQLRAANTSSAIRKRALEATQRSNGHADKLAEHLDWELANKSQS